MIAIVAAFFLVSTIPIAVLHHDNNIPSKSLVGSRAPGYKPHGDYYFKMRGTNTYCWYTSDVFPYGDWEGVGAPAAPKLWLW
jgi:hypothetical protein